MITTRTAPPSFAANLLLLLLLFVGSLALPGRGHGEEGATAKAADETAGLSIPTGKGLPVVVRVGLFFVKIDNFDNNEETFTATTDLRLTWADPRLRYATNQSQNSFKEYRASKAEAEITRIWTPRLRFPNRIGDSSFTERMLRVFPNGKVVMLIRTTATYKSPVDISRFPFDHQSLNVEIAAEEDTVETVDFDFSHEDVEFSRTAKDVTLDGWTLGLVNLRRDLVQGWYGDRFATIVASLDMKRLASSTIPVLFIPLFASLLIPFLVVWMNRMDGDGFTVDAFELGNVIIGGLFAVIALSFTISSSYPIIMNNNNAVTWLIALNYIALAVGLFIVVAFYQYNLVSRWFGPQVQEEVFLFLNWGFPLTFLGTGVAIVLLSMA